MGVFTQLASNIKGLACKSACAPCVNGALWWRNPGNIQLILSITRPSYPHGQQIGICAESIGKLQSVEFASNSGRVTPSAFAFAFALRCCDCVALWLWPHHTPDAFCIAAPRCAPCFTKYKKKCGAPHFGKAFWLPQILCSLCQIPATTANPVLTEKLHFLLTKTKKAQQQPIYDTHIWQTNPFLLVNRSSEMFQNDSPHMLQKYSAYLVKSGTMSKTLTYIRNLILTWQTVESHAAVNDEVKELKELSNPAQSLSYRSEVQTYPLEIILLESTPLSVKLLRWMSHTDHNPTSVSSLSRLSHQSCLV